ncbi:hypothetical protein A0H81_12239 [Grifola frondosa]|uniref:Uncharacterized protein n=1 Tax=Grifola frondosa TaxID=5627 RepID=A0A1C7LT96_GRIFR|nr:hypothetical protein A0H81_12239 [Grifola frondosa]
MAAVYSQHTTGMLGPSHNLLVNRLVPSCLYLFGEFTGRSCLSTSEMNRAPVQRLSTIYVQPSRVRFSSPGWVSLNDLATRPNHLLTPSTRSDESTLFLLRFDRLPPPARCSDDPQGLPSHYRLHSRSGALHVRSFVAALVRSSRAPPRIATSIPRPVAKLRSQVCRVWMHQDVVW